MPWKSRVKPRDFSVPSARGLPYLFRCLICIPCYTFLNLRSLTLLEVRSSDTLILTTLEGLCHFWICSSVLFNGDLGLSSSSKSVTSFLLSSIFLFCFIFLFLSFLLFLLIYIFRLEPDSTLISMSYYCLPFFFLVQPCSVLFVKWTSLSLALPPYFFYTKLSPLWQMTWLLGL